MKRKTINQSMLGDEPKFAGEASETDIIRALNYYNYLYDIKSTKKWILSWMKDAGYTNDKITAYSKSNHPYITQSMASIARMLSRGLVSLDMKDKLVRHIDEVGNHKPIKIVTHQNKRINEVIADIDEILDDFYLQNYKDVLEFEVASDAKSVDIRSAHKYYSELLDEVRTEKEGYSHLKAAQRKRYIETLENLVESLALKNVTVKRKARKKRAPSADKIVSKVKYQQAHENYISLDPVTILDSNVLFLYNSKTRQLAKYEAPTGEKLTVKGTTLDNIHTCVQYKLRKPDDILPSIVTGNRKVVDSAVKSIKTKPSEPSGRLNETTLILRGFK